VEKGPSELVGPVLDQRVLAEALDRLVDNHDQYVGVGFQIINKRLLLTYEFKVHNEWNV
jgi:hypothetical protein